MWPRARASLGAAAPEESAGGAAPLTRDAAERALGDLLRRMLRSFLDLAEDGAAARFVVRERTQPGPAFDVLYDGYMRDVHERVTALVAVVTDRPASAEATVIDAHAVIGMALGFAVAREALLRRAGWTEYSPAHVDAVSESVAACALRALTAPESPAGVAASRSRKGAR